MMIPSTSGLFKRIGYNAKLERKNKLLIGSGLVATATFDTKAKEMKKKQPDITNQATKAGLNTKAAEVESKIPDITNLTTRPALNANATQIENKINHATDFIAIPEFNRLTKISK